MFRCGYVVWMVGILVHWSLLSPLFEESLAKHNCWRPQNLVPCKYHYFYHHY